MEAQCYMHDVDSVECFFSTLSYYFIISLCEFLVY